MTQTELSTGARTAHPIDDFIGLLPHGVMPTGPFYVLEQGDNLVFIKYYKHGQKVKPLHKRIYKLLVRHGTNTESPGSITVLAEWGFGPTKRTYIEFDGFGEHPPVETDIDGWRAKVRDWWDRQPRGRR